MNFLSTILDSPTKTCATSLVGISLGYSAIKGLRKVLFDRVGSLSYPPGPPRDFLIGALRSFPKGYFLDGFCQWAETYGDIVYAPLPGMPMIILNSYEVAQELLAKRPNSTAGRRLGYLLSDLVGWNWNLGLVQPGIHHSNQRKMLRRAIGPQRVGSHDPLIESVVAKLMTVLNTFEGNPNDVIQDCIGDMVSKVTYGDQIWDEMGQDLSHWNKDVMSIVNEAAFSFWLVDIFHFLRFIPDWIPGLRFKHLAREGSELNRKIRHEAYKKSLKLYESGTLGHCILHDLLEEFGDNEDVQDATAVLYAAGADSTTGGVIQFLHALFLFPDVAQKVFEEIDGVTQGQRLLKVNDRAKLPFTEAVWKEAVRWHPFFPLSAPHVNDQDEVIRGYFIPKGTMIHQNTKQMLNDPKVWGDPKVFRPERFLEPGASQRPNPLTTIFGWGMRVCAGMYLADRVVFHLVTTVISLYKIEPLKGSKIPDPNSIEYTPTTIQQPVDFKCRFVARNEMSQNLLKTISLND
ncbi:cytochrome P450 [Serendipita vermifera]|nr:cytochrome P450 [Serendipita vermifera]